MTNTIPASELYAGVDVQEDGFAIACFQADKLEAQAKGLHAAAQDLRSQFDISVHITPSSATGRFSVLTRIGGQYASSQLVNSPEEASQLAYLIIQGCPPALHLPPFGTRVDRKQSEIVLAAAESGQSE